MNILVSACLLGLPCRYDGASKENAKVLDFLARSGHTLIPLCPEQLGGLATPRHPAERQGDRVVTIGDQDVTAAYRRGGEAALRLARLYRCRYAILKERSPSCGAGEIYDGSFSGRLVPGDGVAAALLAENGVTVIGESRLEAWAAGLKEDGGQSGAV